MPLSESLLRAQAERELRETRCVCGAAKEKGKSFCLHCFVALPIEMRRQLVQKTREEYATAYDEAKDFLRIETDRLKQGPLFRSGA